MNKNRYLRSNFHDFLKEEGIFEEVSAIAQKELEGMRNKDEHGADNSSQLPDNICNRIGRFFQRIRHALNL